jgi:hypothetical protein
VIRYRSHKQLPLSEFDRPFQVALDENNRWVKSSQYISWDELAEGYCRSLSEGEGRSAKDTRLGIVAVIIKHKQCLSDEETVEQIRENPVRSRNSNVTLRQTRDDSNSIVHPVVHDVVLALSRRRPR